MKQEYVKLSENIIIADADYIDKVAFDLIVNFERMLGRRIPKADMSRWALNIALDGGLRENGKEHETQIVLIHDKKNPKLENFTPSDYEKELNAQAFKDEKLGEFLVNAYPVEDLIGKDEYILELLNTVCSQEHEEVKRIMIVGDFDDGDLYNRVRAALRSIDDEKKHVTVFAMQPLTGGNFKQEILGYSLMNALGISADELDKLR